MVEAGRGDSRRNKKEDFTKLGEVKVPGIDLGTWERDGISVDAFVYADIGSDPSESEGLTLDDVELLRRLELMPITHWNFIDDDDYNELYPDRPVYHIGPVAQDFYKAFGLGSADTRVKSTDLAGVALAGIKALIAQNKELRQKLDAQQEELQLQREINTNFESRLKALEQ